MGFFSWNCNECKHPMLSQYAINDINSWMNDVVVITLEGEILKGTYDGYGRVNGESFHEPGNSKYPACYHLACWNMKQRKFTEYKPSEYSADQGYFFEPGVHDLPEPKLQSLKEIPERVCRDHPEETYTPDKDCPLCKESV